jgi:WD40 repeat protein
LATELYEPTRDSFLGVHPNGRLAALSQSGVIEVIDMHTGELVETLNHPNQLDQHLGLFPVIFSPDGHWLAAANGSGQLVVWDAQTWKHHKTWDTVPGFTSDGVSMVFTQDSDFLVTGGGGQAAIWNVEQGASGGVQLQVDPGSPDTRVWVGVRDDGKTLATFTEGTGVRKWDVSSEGLLEHACAFVGRNLTQEEWNDVLPDRPYQRTCSQ